MGRFGLSLIPALYIFLCVQTAAEPGREGADTVDRSTARYDSPVDPAAWPLVEPPLIDDPAAVKRLDALISRMTLEQKVGQVIQADSASVTAEDVRRYRLGSILSGGNSAPGDRPYADAATWIAAADAYFDASVDPDGVEVAIPVMWGIDAVHGHNNVIGGTLFPHNIGLGAVRDAAVLRKIAAVVARELRVTGHDWTFAPTLAVPQDDRWGRTYEGFSEDPTLVAAYARAAVEGFQGVPGTADFLGPEKVLSTAKHFLGDGATDEGRDQGDISVGEAALRDIHGAGYPPAIAAGVQSVMASFSSWRGRKTHGDAGLLTEILAGRLGFDGIRLGDWNAHGQIEGCTNESCPVAFNAGLDMFMAPDSWKGLYENTLAQVRSGTISEARLDEAVRRILRVKLRAGILNAKRPSQRPLAGDMNVLGAPEHRALAREAVRRSLVLLKNDAGLLPVSPDARVLVAGDGADDMAKQAGGWTLTWQGGDLDRSLFPNGETILEGIRAAVAGGGGRVVHSEDGTYTDRPDVAIVVFGENPYAEFRGDIDHLAYGARSLDDLALLKRLKAADIPVVSVFLTGRPLWTNPEINASDAFVVAWLPGSEGGGVADMLFRPADGAAPRDFRGTLPFSWPAGPRDFKANTVGGTDRPLFPVGHGLTLADRDTLKPLPEDPGDLGTAGTANVIFADGRLTPPWAFVTDSADTASVTVAPVDTAVQEGGVALTFPEAGAVAWIRRPTPVNLQRETNADLELIIRIRTDRALDGWQIGMACDGPGGCAAWLPLPADSVIPGTWQDLRLSLSCFETRGVEMARVTSILGVRAGGPGRLSVAAIRIDQDEDGRETCR